jgi:hypothetical protein
MRLPEALGGLFCLPYASNRAGGGVKKETPENVGYSLERFLPSFHLFYLFKRSPRPFEWMFGNKKVSTNVFYFGTDFFVENIIDKKNRMKNNISCDETEFTASYIRKER